MHSIGLDAGPLLHWGESADRGHGGREDARSASIHQRGVRLGVSARSGYPRSHRATASSERGEPRAPSGKKRFGSARQKSAMEVRGGVRTDGSAVVAGTAGLLVNRRHRLVSTVIIARVVLRIVAERGVRVPVAAVKPGERPIVETPLVGLAEDELLELGEFAVAGAVTQPVGVELNERVPLLVGGAVALGSHRRGVQSGGHHLALFSPPLREREKTKKPRPENRQRRRPRPPRLCWACETNALE